MRILPTAGTGSSSSGDGVLVLLLVVWWSLLSPCQVSGDIVRYTWVVEDWVVDFLRPTLDLKGRFSQRQTPFDMADDKRSGKQLVNGLYPGPTIEAFEDDTVEVTVINRLLSDNVVIHWHGIHPVAEPWDDGAHGVTQAPIQPGQNYTYSFTAFPAGTHYYHSHMDSTQSAKGLKGPIVIKRRDDPFKDLYTEEKVIFISDEWLNPDVCLKLEGAIPGNDVCADVEYGSWNGQYGNGTVAYPYPVIDVEAGTCYRLRFIGAMSNAENFIIEVAGHSMTLLTLDGNEVEPIQISGFNLHLGERYDVVLCADQAPGCYVMTATYDYACSLEPGNFIPPGFHAVPSCRFYALLKYESKHELFHVPRDYPPSGSGGGAKPRPVDLPRFDLTQPSSWHLTRSLHYDPEPEKADITYVVSMGLLGPAYQGPTDHPLTHGRWYIDLEDRRHPWRVPFTPLLHTKCQCGTNDAPIIHVPENVTNVEVVINNLSPTAHIVHLHGFTFKVMNVANFTWCSLDKISCFLLPETHNPCPPEDRAYGDPTHPEIGGHKYWGCRYNENKDRQTQNLDRALQKDTVQVWQRSWMVIRFKADKPFIAQFHCHDDHHVMLSMQSAFNILPSKLKPLPKKALTEGPCPSWWEKEEGEEEEEGLEASWLRRNLRA